MWNLSGHAFRTPVGWPESAAERCVRLGGFLDGDAEAQGLQLADVVADLAVAADAVVVAVRSEVVEPGGRVGEQVEDDDEDRAGDRGQGLAFPAPSGQAAVALADELVFAEVDVHGCCTRLASAYSAGNRHRSTTGGATGSIAAAHCQSPFQHLRSPAPSARFANSHGICT
jgi:hypothetical protein